MESSKTKLVLCFVSAVACCGATACVVDTTPQTPPPPPATVVPAPATPAPATPVVEAPPAAAPVAAAPVAAPPVPQPAYAPPARPAAPPYEHKVNEGTGQPSRMHAGAALGMWIWHDGKGVNWHFRSTTETNLHRFTGRVWPDAGGALSDIRPLALESRDRIRPEGAELTFDFSTKGGLDGFDFHLTGSRCLAFYLLVDGKPDPSRVFIGAANHPANAAAITLCR